MNRQKQIVDAIRRYPYHATLSWLIDDKTIEKLVNGGWHGRAGKVFYGDSDQCVDHFFFDDRDDYLRFRLAFG